MPVYWTHDPENPRDTRIGFACPTFPDVLTIAIMAGVGLYLFNGWLS